MSIFPMIQPAESAGGTAEQAEGEYIRHKVEWGETLYGIARRYGVKVEDIVALNPGVEKVLYADAVILIPARRK